MLRTRTRAAVLAALTGLLLTAGAPAPGAADAPPAPPGGPTSPAVAAAPALTCTAENAGALQGTTVRGDVYLTEGCDLYETWVQGDVHVGPHSGGWEGGADVYLWDTRVDGDVHVADGVLFTARYSQIGGDVRFTDPVWARVDGTVGGDVVGTASEIGIGARVGGLVDVRLPVRTSENPDPGFRMHDAEVQGPVTVVGGTAEVANSWLHDALTLSDVHGVVVAETRVEQDVVVEDTRGAVHLGDVHEVEVDGPPEWLDDGQQEQSPYGGDLTVRGAAGSVTVGHVDVAGDLVCADNAAPPAVQGSVRVGGARTGQCADAPPPEPAPAPVPDPFVCADARPPTVVPGDLVVTGSCDVRALTVLGDVHVQTTDFMSFGGRIAGDLHLGPGARAEVLAGTIGGGVHLDRVATLDLRGTVGRSVRGKGTDVRLRRVDVSGAVNVAAPEGVPGARLVLQQARGGGWVNVHGGTPQVVDAELSRGLTTSWARAVHVCGTRVLADVTVLGTQGAVRIGGRPTAGGCAGDGTAVPNVLGAGLVLDRNRSRPVVRATSVAGDLDCRDNSGRPTVGPDATVGGARLGQCA
ncbi:hypothetical protein GC089_02990 [Cellulomonas sp. JZ18]|uniref:hypothetical protein n=1 Tax=Cellulomonas sp. JZ18 TaxID=2654191 RepID=UPI0012D4520C|nr:hypothetical protein [Cellulomonas sp. JZ18]QGQ18409.1 hypothetical protein GC089_02990 [Cellulomonas sp. JZ18]